MEIWGYWGRARVEGLGVLEREEQRPGGWWGVVYGGGLRWRRSVTEAQAQSRAPGEDQTLSLGWREERRGGGTTRH